MFFRYLPFSLARNSIKSRSSALVSLLDEVGGHGGRAALAVLDLILGYGDGLAFGRDQADLLVVLSVEDP